MLFAVRAGLRPAVAAVVTALGLTGCDVLDVVTDPPILQSQFVLPGETTTIGVAQLLPPNVTVSGNSFLVSVSPVTVSRTLGELCGAPCSLLNGQTVPKPPFTAVLTATSNLPTDVRSATLTSGNVVVSLTNGFGFDPLQPGGPAGAKGSIAIRMMSGQTVLGTRTIDGATRTFAPNSTITETIPVSGALSNSVTAEVTINSPAGNPVTINTSQSFTLSAAPQNFAVSTATVNVNNRTVSANNVTVELSGVDNTIANRVVSGAMLLTITNPFGVTGTLNVTFAGTTVPTKTFTLRAGTNTERVDFSGAELRELLGRDLVMSISGPVNGPASGVAITPTQQLTVVSRLELTLSTQSQVTN